MLRNGLSHRLSFSFFLVLLFFPDRFTEVDILRVGGEGGGGWGGELRGFARRKLL